MEQVIADLIREQERLNIRIERLERQFISMIEGNSEQQNKLE